MFLGLRRGGALFHDLEVVGDLRALGQHDGGGAILVGGQLYLQGTNRQIQILVNRENYLQFDNRLSIVGKSQRYFKDISNQNADMIIEDQTGKHMLVKDAQYRIGPWVNLGIVKPEEKLIRDAAFLHDISQNK